MEQDESSYIGRKTFFIAPDLTLLPELYMREYMTRGYEAYIINDERSCPMTRKVDLLISMYADSILFFYIDAHIDGIEWQKYIYKLQREHGDRILIGVLYAKSKTEEERKRLEHFYLFDVGIQCGCIALDFQHKKNFPLIDRVMKVNQAEGRRKTVRATCEGSSEVTFIRDGNQFRGKLVDISLNHFSCLLTGESLPLYSKVRDMMLVVDGVHIQTNGVLLLQRKTSEDTVLNVFAFARLDGSLGLDGGNFERVSQKIYQTVSSKTKEVLQRIFVTAGRELEDEQAAERLREQAIENAKKQGLKHEQNQKALEE